MSDIRSTQRVVRSERNITRAANCHRIALAAGCALVVAALVVSPSGAMAGCNSGNAADAALLSGAGCQASASDTNATAVGQGATANDTASTALGTASTAGVSGSALGAFSTAGPAGTSVGLRATTTGSLSVAIGKDSQGTGTASVAIGAGGNGDLSARALGLRSIAIGGSDVGSAVDAAEGALAAAEWDVVIGVGAAALGIRSTVVGSLAGSDGDPANHFSTAFGQSAGVTVRGSLNTAIGVSSGARVTGDSNTALGGDAGSGVTGSKNTASGGLAGTNVEGNSNSAYGYNAGANVTGIGNVAIGRSAGRGVTASHTVAIGTNARARGESAAAIGNAAVATGARSVALGSGSVTGAADTVSVGSRDRGRRIINVAPAINPTDAVNLGQVQALVSFAVAAASARNVQLSSFGYRDREQRVGQDALVAEEVATVYPELVPSAEVGDAHGIRNEELIPLLLSELQKQQRALQEQHLLLLRQQQELADLRARMEPPRSPSVGAFGHVTAAAGEQP